MFRYYTVEQVQQAKNADLVDILPHLGYQLKKRGSKEYCLEDHDSLTINREKGWYWNSKSVGGNAIDFFMIGPEQLSFIDAVARILDQEETSSAESKFIGKSEKRNNFKIPIANYDTDRAYRYLTKKRGLNADLIAELIQSGSIYEEAKTHNAVFLGYDYQSCTKYAFLRGTSEKRFAGTSAGSDKRYTFRISSGSTHVHVFEASIDLLSYLTIEKLKGNPIADCYLSLEGVSMLALDTFLLHNTEIKTIHINLDNDKTGQTAARKLKSRYTKGYEVILEPPVKKDYNEDLLAGAFSSHTITRKESV